MRQTTRAAAFATRVVASESKGLLFLPSRVATTEGSPGLQSWVSFCYVFRVPEGRHEGRDGARGLNRKKDANACRRHATKLARHFSGGFRFRRRFACRRHAVNAHRLLRHDAIPAPMCDRPSSCIPTQANPGLGWGTHICVYSSAIGLATRQSSQHCMPCHSSLPGSVHFHWVMRTTRR